MKGIFFTNTSADVLYKVYSPEIREKLKIHIEMDPQIITYKMLAEKNEKFEDCDYIFSTWGMPHCSEYEIKTYFPNVKAVFYAAGSVQDFAREFLHCGVKIISAWGANAVPVAEYTVAQIILANKGYFQNTRINKHSEKRKYTDTFPGTFETKVGIIGCGMIGSIVARMLKTYRVEILVFDPFLSDEKANQLGVTKCSLEEIFSECQTISNHLANNEQTKGMLNYELFSRMKENATFINTGRGAQVVEDDLIRALKDRPARTALLDVTFPEPPKEDSELYTLANVFLSPHIAGSMGNELARMGEYMYDEFIAMINGLPFKYEVTEKMLETMA